MQTENYKIKKIPAVLWGGPAERVIIAVHGSQSSKTDVPIELLAKAADSCGYQVLSFDLPEHGERRGEPPLFKIQTATADLKIIMSAAQENWQRISLFGNSIGAYLSLLAYGDVPLERAWFLSPVTDMQRIIESMMAGFGVSPERLERELTVDTPIGQTLYWEDYCTVKAHPIRQWITPTNILYGEKDDICESGSIRSFTRQFSCQLEIVPDGEHYFHTPEQLAIFSDWLERTL